MQYIFVSKGITPHQRQCQRRQRQLFSSIPFFSYRCSIQAGKSNLHKPCLRYLLI